MRATFLLLLTLLVACGGTDDPDSKASPSTWCGDGKVDDGEACDDGGASAGCNEDCTLAACGDGKVNPAAGEQCDEAGESVDCDADCTVAWCGDGTANAAAGEGCDDGDESASCNLDCTVASCGDGRLNPTAGEACDDAGESASCNADCSYSTCGDGVRNATAGEDCDEAGTSATCDADCTVPTCGDADANPLAGEECDHGYETAGCDWDCTLVSCGDGVANLAAGEACDDAGDSAACDADCTPVECGDGVVNAAAGEDCEEGGIESATCDADCTVVECGDGVVNQVVGEPCDDGGDSPTCDADCTPVSCGDGTTNPAAGEECDDAGQSATCDLDCTLAICGDGVRNAMAGEVCDEGGATLNCTANCQLPVCGDGFVDVGEDCDDGGDSAACDADCTWAECGDGTLNAQAGEVCDDGREGLTCDVTCALCPTAVYLDEDFSDNSAGWIGAAGFEWEIGTATASSGHAPTCGNADPADDHTPTADNGVAGVQIGGNVDVSSPHGYIWLTSPVVAAGEAAELRYWRWLNSDREPGMVNRVEVYDGSDWQVLWESSGGIEDSQWIEQVHDLTPYVNPNLRVRFGYMVGFFADTCSGWNLDDVTITGPACDPADIPVLIEDQSLPDGLENVPYLVGATATGGSGSGTWSIVGGTNHTWLAINPAGVLSGTPGATDLGPVSVTVRFEEALNPVDNVHDRTFDFEVFPDTDADGVADEDDLCEGYDDLLDTDGDGVPDGCDVSAGTNDALQVVGFVDADGDGFGDAFDPGTLFCALDPGFVLDATDCDDSDPTVYPFAPEYDGDAIDSNCDGLVDNPPAFLVDFEAGALDPAFTLGGNADWFASTADAYAGTYSAECGNIGDDQSTTLSITLDYPTPGELQFWHTGSTEASFDYFELYIDGTRIDRWSGTWPWQQEVVLVSAGVYTVEWVYVKDWSVSNGLDTVWVDDIRAVGGYPL